MERHAETLEARARPGRRTDASPGSGRGPRGPAARHPDLRQLVFDFDADPIVQPATVPRPGLSRRQARGLCAWLSGQAAEEIVARHYEARGVRILARRWRGTGGEIDLVLRAADSYVFCEVKRAASFDAALARLRQGQLERIYRAASEYLGLTPEGQLAPVRFDVAAVDATGAVHVLEAAFGHF
jgi:putative endonuclease